MGARRARFARANGIVAFAAPAPQRNVGVAFKLLAASSWLAARGSVERDHLLKNTGRTSPECPQ
jgi:hypothetical protein